MDGSQARLSEIKKKSAARYRTEDLKVHGAPEANPRFKLQRRWTVVSTVFSGSTGGDDEQKFLEINILYIIGKVLQRGTLIS